MICPGRPFVLGQLAQDRFSVRTARLASLAPQALPVTGPPDHLSPGNCPRLYVGVSSYKKFIGHGDFL